jgi:hypothetical protein
MKHIKLFEQFVNEELAYSGAMSTKHTKEENDALFAEVEASKKANEFFNFTTGIQKFDSSLFQNVMDFIHSLDKKQLKVFLDGLGKYASPDKLSSNFSSEFNNGNVGNQLFTLGSNVVPNGLIFTAWLVAGAIPVKNAIFNLNISGKKYNAIDLTSSVQPFSLGKAIQPAYQLAFVKEMEKVCSVIEEIAGNQSYKTENADLYKNAIATANFADSSPSMDFSNGEVSEPLFRAVVTFIESANELLSSGKINNPELNATLSKSPFIVNGITFVIRSANDEITNAERKAGAVVNIIFRSNAMNVSDRFGKITGKTAKDLHTQYGLFTKDSKFAISGLEFRVREDV